MSCACEALAYRLTAPWPARTKDGAHVACPSPRVDPSQLRPIDSLHCLSMAKHEKVVPEIVRVAEELEAEMAQLESIARAAKKARRDSEKNIAKAAGDLSEAVTMPGRMAERLQARHRRRH